MATTPDKTLPENSDLGFSYEYGVDVQIDGVWQPCRFISNVEPSVTPVTQSAQTYEDLGAPNDQKVSESWTLSYYIQLHYIEGAVLPEVAALRKATEPDATGEKANVNFRWYDKPATRKADPDEAYSGRGSVQLTRAQTGADGQVSGYNVTVTGQGRRLKIQNPMLEGTAA